MPSVGIDTYEWKRSTMERWRDFVWTAIAAASAVTAGSVFYIAVMVEHMGGHCR